MSPRLPRVSPIPLQSRQYSVKMNIVRYCLNGHWDNPKHPIYMRRMKTSELARQASALKARLETVKFCERCGAELIRSCQECGASLQHGADGDAPQHCGGCGKPFPWSVHAVPINELPLENPVEGSKEIVRTHKISASSGSIKKFALKAKSLLIKAGPAVQQVGAKVLTDYIEKKTGL
jgi:hypothetical protein